ncbi:MAG TPA: hypothetical protein VIX86_00855, partial [Streptosporangiaceae bacterium]
MSGRQQNALRSGVWLLVSVAAVLICWRFFPAIWIPITAMIGVTAALVAMVAIIDAVQRRKARDPSYRPRSSIAPQALGATWGLSSIRGAKKPRAQVSRSAKPKPKPKRKRRVAQLSPDATVTLAEVRRETGVDEVFEALDSDLVGLVPVKKKVEEIGSLLLVDRVRQMFGLDAPRPNLHMCF